MPQYKDAPLIDEALAKYDSLVNSSYLFEIFQFPLCTAIADPYPIRLLQIKVFPETPTYSNLSFVFNALAGMGAVIGYIVDSTLTGITLYIGVKNQDPSCTTYLLLKNGLINTFPDIVLSEPSPKETIALLDCWFDPNLCSLLCATTVTPLSSYETPPLSEFTSLMGTETYIAFFLASPLLRYQVYDYLNELITLYNTFSMYTQTNHNILEGVSLSDSHSLSDSDSITNSNNCTKTDGTNNSFNSSCYTNISPSTSIPITAERSISISMLHNNTAGNTHGSSFSCAHCDTYTHTATKTTTDVHSKSTMDNHSIGYSCQNKYLMDAQLKLNLLIERIQAIVNKGVFEFGAYFLSPFSETSLRAAYTYQGLALSNTNPVNPTAVNYWPNTSPDFSSMLCELKQFNHPIFEINCHHKCAPLTSIIQSTELVNSIYFPYPPPSSSPF